MHKSKAEIIREAQELSLALMLAMRQLDDRQFARYKRNLCNRIPRLKPILQPPRRRAHA